MGKLQKIIGVMVLFLLLVVNGCAGLQSLFQPSRDGLPSWISAPQVPSGYTAIIGIGEGPSERSSRLLAYQDVSRQLTRTTGLDKTEEWYRELSTSEGIKELKAQVSRSYVRPGEGSYVSYIMIAVESSLLDTMRTDALKAIEERNIRITNLQQEARFEFRDNKDISALLLYMEAAAIAVEGPVEGKENSLENILERIDSILKSLSFRVQSFDPAGPSLSVSIRRKRLFSPRVLEAPVQISFHSVDAFGKQYSDYMSTNTGPLGTAAVDTMNPAMMRQGHLVVSLDIMDEFAAFRTAVGDAAAPMEAQLQKLALQLEYAKNPPILSSRIIVDVTSHSSDGDRVATDVTEQAFMERFAMDGIELEPVDLVVDYEDELVPKIRRDYPQAEYAISGKAGVTEVFTPEGKTVVVVTGEANLIRVADGQTVASTQLQQTLAWGVNQEDASTKALTDNGYLLAARLLNYVF